MEGLKALRMRLPLKNHCHGERYNAKRSVLQSAGSCGSACTRGMLNKQHTCTWYNTAVSGNLVCVVLSEYQVLGMIMDIISIILLRVSWI